MDVAQPAPRVTGLVLAAGQGRRMGVPKALLDVHASLGTAVGSMQALAVANPDLYINLADMIVGTMTPEQVAKATQDQFAQLAKAAGAPGF